jgi:hypothetical protein
MHVLEIIIMPKSVKFEEEKKKDKKKSNAPKSPGEINK